MEAACRGKKKKNSENETNSTNSPQKNVEYSFLRVYFWFTPYFSETTLWAPCSNVILNKNKNIY